MRSIKLTTAVAVAAGFMLLTSAAALALGRHEHREGKRFAEGCRLSLEVAPRPAYAGESVTAWGDLTGKDCTVEKQPVTLYERSVTSPTYTKVGEGTTGKGGSFLLSNVTTVSTDTVFYMSTGTVSSAPRVIKVLALVKLTGPPEGVLYTIEPHPHRHRVAEVFTGEVSPADKGARVILQRQDALKGNEWHRIGPPGVVEEDGKFTIEHNFVVAGPANIRVLIRDPKVNVPSASNVLTYEITQAQNPNLLIESLADPISYGQSTTIHGKALKLATNTTLELLAREAHTPGFVKVGETKVQPGGTYSFASVSPLASTFYRVLGGGESSAVLYEGVKYLLSPVAVTPGTTVEQGQTVTFKGTVAPGIAGHEIYLERENPSGTSFHVIDTGQLSEPTEPEPGKKVSTYTIEHKFYAEGSEVVRIKIPGDPQNGSTASEPITLQINPSATPMLTPVPPGNSKLPAEGQF
jgi:hypothetical protein